SFFAHEFRWSVRTFASWWVGWVSGPGIVPLEWISSFPGKLVRCLLRQCSREPLTFCIGEMSRGMAPRRILLVHGKAEASFAHSKRFAQYDIAIHVGASRCEGATEPRGSVWSARSLLA